MSTIASTALAAVSSVLAQGDSMDPWEGVQKAFRNALPREHGEPSVWAAAAVFVSGLLALVIILYVIARVVQRGRVEESARTPMRFFSFALKQLDVGVLDRLLLRRLARASGLPQPTVMLFSPDLWEEHAGQWADKLVFPPLRAYARDRVHAVAAKAFPSVNAS